ncbi:hypothetical protein A9Q83_03465 [Alphaproteobacteria bacterium 46_93_T64]|nr:hypothetical protein A9Q83_03465 [Alphaproteobacteria bacterium 46_93_T64]
MALGKNKNQFMRQSIRLLCVAAAGLSLTALATAQTVIIGGANRQSVTVNMNTVYGNYQQKYQPSIGSTDYSKSAKIIDGNEVITLIPPGSQVKKKKVAAKPVKRKIPKSVAVKKSTAPVKKIEKAAPKIAKVAPPKAPKIGKNKTQSAPAETVTKETMTVATPAPAKKIVESKKETVVSKAPTPVIPKATTTEPKEAEIKVASVAPEQTKKPVAPQKKMPAIEPEVAANLQQIFFEKDETKLPASAKTDLQKLAEMVASSSKRVQLVAYADASSNGTARRLSLGRALVIRSQLMKFGVPNNKIEVRALGKPTDNSPADRVDLKLVAR